MGKIIRYAHISGTRPSVNPRESFVRSMSDQEARRRAKADPDAPLIDPKTFHKFKRVKP